VVQAFILIQTEVGQAAAVAQAIAELPGVTSAEDVTGPYDVIVRAEANTVDELGKVVGAYLDERIVQFEQDRERNKERERERERERQRQRELERLEAQSPAPAAAAEDDSEEE